MNGTHWIILYLLLTSARKEPKGIAKIGILGLLILAFIYLGFADLLPERLQAFNLHHRMPRWVAALKIAEDNLLTGVGFKDIKSMSLDRISQEDVVREMNTHNLYLEFLTATGLFGVLALMAFIGKSRRVKDISTLDLQSYKRKLQKSYNSAHRLNLHISIMIILKFRLNCVLRHI